MKALQLKQFAVYYGLSDITRKYRDFDQTETKTEIFKFVRAQTN
jgi:hypothetical protein